MKYSTKEVAEYLNCSKRGIHYLVKKGVLKPINHHKEFFLFDENEVLTLKNTRTHGN